MSVAPLCVELDDGVLLRRPRLTDAAAMAATRECEQAFFAPYEPDRPAGWATEAAQRESLAVTLADADAGRSVPHVLVAGDEVLGMVNLSNVVRGALQSADLGYWLAQGWNGRGLVTRSVDLVCEHARDLGLHRVAASTLLDNERSQAILRRTGFTEIGDAPDYLRIAGRWQTHRIFQRILHD